jgi:hypothetical protein
MSTLLGSSLVQPGYSQAAQGLHIDSQLTLKDDKCHLASQIVHLWSNLPYMKFGSLCLTLHW